MRRPNKMGRKYRIARTPRNPSVLLLEGRQRVYPKVDSDEGRQRVYPKVDSDDNSFPTKAEIDLELAKMRNMTPKEAAAAAAKAVAEAEAAIAEAEEAEREAEAAEADAEAAQAFAEAAMKSLRGKNTSTMIFRA